MGSIPPELLKFEDLIEPHLNDAQVISYKTCYLTKPGENYGSIILAVTVNIQEKAEKSPKKIEMVAKMPPLTELHWQLFQPDRTCPTENSIYTTIAPILKEFQQNAKVPPSKMLDVFSKFYGARLSIDRNQTTGTVVDRNALLVLENLTASGYKTCFRDEGFDLKHTLVVLRNLAKFHAVPIAYRNSNPEQFQAEILPTLKHFNINDNFDEGEFESLVARSVADIMKLSEIINDNLINNIKKLLKLNAEYMSDPSECQNGPFNTIAHYDLWVNNMMFLYDDQADPIKMKILDFQLSQYESLAHDVIFFLFSSVKTSILENKYDELLEFYYEQFIANLEANGCYESEYSMDLFLDEIKRIAPIQFSHIVVMLKVLFMKRGAMPDNFEDINMDVWTQDENYDEKYFNKLRDIIVLYQKFGYLCK